MSRTPRLARPSCEGLESRRLLASAGTLLSYDFNAGTAWSALATTTSNGVAASAAQSAVGTVDAEGTSTKTGAVALSVTSAPSTSTWTSALTSGKLALANPESSLGKLTLGFNLSASQARAVKVIVTSYDAAGGRTGALESIVTVAAVDSFQRFAVDLSTMSASGSGTFAPTAPFVSFDFQVGGGLGWSGGTSTLRVDDVQFSKPAYYVSSIDGKNTDNGTTEALAFATIQKAIDVSQAGDVICVMGDAAHPYTVSANNRNSITHGGTPAAWITFKNYPGQSPVISTEGWAAIQVGDSLASTRAAIGYVEIRGLHVIGSSLRVGSRAAPDGNYDPTAANADQYGPYAKYLQPIDPATGKAGTNAAGTGVDSRTNGNGLSIDGSNEANKPHDIRFADNLVEQCAGGGIGAGDADRIQFENNVTRDNCYWDKYGTSGISILSTYQFEATTSASAGTVERLLRNNVSSGNIHKEKWVRNDPVLTQYSDGNGIILDVNTGYDFRTLATNNVVFDNGGSGIHAYRADHVDIVNNVGYLNSASPYLQYGQIFSQGTDTRIYNNILVAPVAPTGSAKESVNGGTKPTASNGIVYKNNVYFGGNTAAWAADAYNIGNVTGDPKFVLASTDRTVADFHLQSASPAINLGAAALASYLDADGNLHYASPDSGAYEFVPAAPTSVALAIASDTGVAGDNRTNLNNATAAARLSFVVGGTLAGATVTLYANGVAVGTATAAGTSTTVTTDGTTALADGSVAITAIQTFAGAPSAASPMPLAVTIDTTGPSLAAANAFVVDDGTVQRSRIRTLTLTFAEAVTLTAGSLTVTNATTGLAAPAFTLTAAANNTSYTLSFAGPATAASGGSLDDGVWQLTLPAMAARDAAGNTLAGGGKQFGFHRLFGDANGDRAVTIADFNVLAAAFGTTAGDASFNAAVDANGDDAITIADFNALASRFGTSLPDYAPVTPLAATATRRAATTKARDVVAATAVAKPKAKRRA